MGLTASKDSYITFFTVMNGMYSVGMLAMPGKMIMYRNVILSSKAVMNLKALESDRSMFRNWNDKLINALSQAVEQSIDVMEWIIKQIANTCKKHRVLLCTICHPGALPRFRG